MFLDSIIKGGITGIIDSVSDTVDRFITTGDEKQAFKLELLKIKHAEENKLLGLVAEAEKTITDRHKADMMSDSWLSKNVRPLVLLFLLSTFIIFSVLDMASDDLLVDPEYVKMLKDMLDMSFRFYFAGRSLEKIVGMIKGDKKNKI
jgi:hypothetical protein